MPKVSSQKKPELNYQITDPCYGREGGKEEEIQATSRTNDTKREEMTIMVMEMERLIEVAKKRVKTIKNSLKIMSMKTIRIM